MKVQVEISKDKRYYIKDIIMYYDVRKKWNCKE